MGGRGRQPAHRVPLVLLLLLSPFPLPLILLFFLVSPNVLRLRRKCAVSSCTSSMLSSLHVNKHPKCIIGTVLYVHAVQHAADGLVTPAKAHQSDTDVPVPPSTTVNYNPHPAPTGGDVAPSMDSNQPHPHPPACCAGCCLVILAWQSPRFSQLLPRGRLQDTLTFI